MDSDDPRRRQREWDEQARAAQARAAQAYERLLALAEKHDSGQARTVARFIASTFDGETFPLDPFDLRTVDVAISDDMLQCLDALRWGKADLHKLLPGDGRKRIIALCASWGLKWPDEA